MTWADLFERATEYEATERDAREELERRRSDDG